MTWTSLWTRVELFGNESPIPRQRYDYMALVLLTFSRWMLGRPVKPLTSVGDYSLREG